MPFNRVSCHDVKKNNRELTLTINSGGSLTLVKIHVTGNRFKHRTVFSTKQFNAYSDNRHKIHFKLRQGNVTFDVRHAEVPKHTVIVTLLQNGL